MNFSKGSNGEVIQPCGVYSPDLSFAPPGQKVDQTIRFRSYVNGKPNDRNSPDDAIKQGQWHTVGMRQFLKLGLFLNNFIFLFN